MRRIWIAKDALQAQELVAALTAAGIRALPLGDALGAAVGEVPANLVGAEVHVVDDADFVAARKIVAEFLSDESQLPVMAGHCPDCGYDLRGSAGARCPECGRLFRVRPEGWICPACREPIEGHFSECWKCGAERPNA